MKHKHRLNIRSLAAMLGLLLLGLVTEAQLSVQTRVPNTALNVGAAGRVFSIVITNTQGTAVTVSSLNIVNSTGVSVPTNTASLRVNSLAATTVNWGNPLVVNKVLNPRDSLVVSYTAAAGCAAVIQNPQIRNSVTVNYKLANGTSDSIPAVTTNPYAIVWPSLALGSTEISTGVGATQNIDVVVSNQTGAGPAGGLQLAGTIPGTLAVTGAKLVNGSKVVNLAIPAGGRFDYTVSSTNLNTLGLDTTFDARESFTLRFETRTRAFEYSSDLEVVATAMFSNSQCDAVKQQINVKIGQDEQKPLVEYNSNQNNVVDRASFCGDSTVIIKYVFTNKGNSAALSFHVYIDGTLDKYISKITSKTGQLIPFDTNYSGDISSDPDNSGGFDDIDGDKIFNDIAPGDSVEMYITIIIPRVALDNSQYNFINTYCEYEDIYKTKSFKYVNSIMDGCKTIVSTGDLPCSIDAKDKLDTFSVDYNFGNQYLQIFGNRTYAVKASVPNGFSINGKGNIVVLPGGIATDNISETSMKQTITVSATSSATCGKVPVKWELYWLQPNCNDSVIVDTHIDTTICYVNCPSTPGVATALGLSIRRVNVGFDLNKMPANEMWTANKISSYPRYTESNCPNATKCTRGDTMRVVGSLQVSPAAGCPARSIFVSYKYDGNKIFTPLSVQLKIGSASAIKLAGNLVNTYTDGNYTIHTILYKLPVAITTGTKVDFNILNSVDSLNEPANKRCVVTSGYVDCNGAKIYSRILCEKIIYKPISYWPWSEQVNICNHIINILGDTALFFPNEFRPLLIAQNYTLQIPAGIAYEKDSILLTYNNRSLYVKASTIENKLIIPLNNIMYDPHFGRFSTALDVSGVVDISTLNDETETGFLVEKGNKSQAFSYSTIGVVRLGIETTGQAQVVGTHPKWDVIVKNISPRDPTPYVMVEFSPLISNNTNVVIDKVVCNSQELKVTTVGSKSYVFLPNLNPGDIAKLKIFATTDRCLDTGTTTVKMRVATLCKPVAPADFDKYASPRYDRDLWFRNSAFALVNSRPSGPQDYFQLCDTLPFSVTVSPANADSSSMSFWFDSLQSNLIIVDNTVNYRYGQHSGKLNLATDKLATQLNKSISSLIMSQGITSWKDDTLTLSFGSRISCSAKSKVTDITDFVKFAVDRNNVCGEQKREIFRFTPNIKGFERRDSIKVAASARGFDAQGKATITVTATNLYPSLVDSVNASAVLPPGVSFVPNSTAISNSTTKQEFDAITSTPLANGSTLVVWAFKRGRHLMGSENLTFTFGVTNAEPCGSNNANILITSLLQRKVTGCLTGDTCLLQATSDSALVSLTRVPPQVIASIKAPDSVCQGSTFTIATTTNGLASMRYSLDPPTAGTVDTLGNVRLLGSFYGDLKVKVSAIKPCQQNSFVTVKVVKNIVATITTPSRTFLSSDASIPLSATPVGGTWSGKGVSGSVFIPADANIGDNVLTYTPKGTCVVSKTVTITVTADCKPALSVGNVYVCQPGDATVPVNTSQLFSCPSCNNDNFMIALQFDNTKLTYKGINLTGSILTSTIAPVSYATLDGNTLYVQIYTAANQKISGMGLLFNILFGASTPGSYPVSITKAYINGDAGANVGALTAGSLVVGNPMVVDAKGGKICPGSPFVINSTVSGGVAPYAYKWSGSTVTASNRTVYTAETFTLTVTDARGCLKKDTAIVKAFPAVVASAKGGSFCSGSTFPINTVVTSGTAPYTYKWSTAATAPSISVGTAGTYRVSITDANKCKATASAVVTVNPSPVVTAKGGSFCAGNSLSVSSTVSSGTSPYSYKWSNAATTNSITTTTAGTYRVTVSDSKNCSASASAVVASNPLPVVSAHGGSFCAGSSFIISSSITGATPYTYKWSNAANTSSVTVNTASTYTLSVTDANSCVGTDTAVVTVKAVPTLPVITGDSTALLNDIKPFSVASQPGAIFTWKGTGANIAAGQGTSAISAQFTNMPATLSVFATNKSCVGPSATKTINKKSIPNFKDSVICLDRPDNSDYSLSVPNPKPGASYSWVVEGGTIQYSSGTTVRIRPNQDEGPVLYTITETLNGIVSTSQYQARRYYRPASGLTEIKGSIVTSHGQASFCNNQKGVLLTATGPTSSFIWKDSSKVATIISGQNTNSAIVDFGSVKEGFVVAYAQNGTGCREWSGHYLHVVMNENCVSGSLTATVSPNPVLTDMTIIADADLKDYTISTITGIPIQSGVLPMSKQATISVVNLANQTYHITLRSTNGGVYTTLFVKK